MHPGILAAGSLMFCRVKYIECILPGNLRREMYQSGLLQPQGRACGNCLHVLRDGYDFLTLQLGLKARLPLYPFCSSSSRNEERRAGTPVTPSILQVIGNWMP